jgi:hypothetical protein
MISPDAMAARIAQLPRALVDVRRTSRAAVREVITERRKRYCPSVSSCAGRGPHSDSSRQLQHLAVPFPRTSKPFSKDALFKLSAGQEINAQFGG